jgi:hypothetical protein
LTAGAYRQQVPFAQDQQMIQTLPPPTTKEAFNDGVHLGRLRGRADHLDARDLGDPCERCSVFAAPYLAGAIRPGGAARAEAPGA